jgi:hypothetical protein
VPVTRHFSTHALDLVAQQQGRFSLVDSERIHPAARVDDGLSLLVPGPAHRMP